MESEISGPEWLRIGAGRAGGRRPCVVEVIDPVGANGPLFSAFLRAETPAALAFRHASALPVLAVDPGRGPSGLESVSVLTPAPSGVPLVEVLRQAEAVGPIPLSFAVHVALRAASLLAALEKMPWKVGSLEGMGHHHLSLSRVRVDGAGWVTVGAVGLSRARACLAPSRDVAALRAPEFLRDPGCSSPAADVYSLGLLLFELLLGRPLYLRDTLVDTRAAGLNGARPRLSRVRSDVDAGLEALVEWMVARDPSARPASAETVFSMVLEAQDRIQRAAQELRRSASPRASTDAPARRASTVERPAPPLTKRVEPLERPSPPLSMPPRSETPSGRLPELLPGPEAAHEISGDLPEQLAPVLPPSCNPQIVIEPAEELPSPPAMAWAEALPNAPALEERFVRLGPVSVSGWAVAADRKTGLRVLLEALPPLPPDRLLERSRAASKLVRHRHVLPHRSLWPEHDGSVLAVSDRVDGEPMSDRIDRDGPLALVELNRWLEQVLGALAHLHRSGFVHGALQPDAVLLHGEGSGLVAVVGGLIHGAAGRELADPSFSAPELAARGCRANPASDLWSVGALTYYALVGAPPSPDHGALRVGRLRPSATGVDRWLPRVTSADPASRVGDADTLLQVARSDWR